MGTRLCVHSTNTGPACLLQCPARGDLMVAREQVRMARAALGWGVRDLAKKAGVAANTVSRFENGAGMMVDTLKQI